MQSTLLFWLYLANAVLLIVHEIDSAYWKEWDLFHLPGGINGFLLIHIPLLAFLLYGLVAVRGQNPSAIVFSLILAGSGIFAFCIHTYFLKKGRPEFRTPVSFALLIMILLISLAQLAVTIINF